MTQTQPTRLLIVDDDPAVRLLVNESLSQHEFTVEQADSGEQALVIINEKIPEMILLDINMPGINGIEVCTHIRGLSGGRHIPILMMTGMDDIESINASYQAGASDFITKPINWPVLIHHVRYMLRASEALQQKQGHIDVQALLNNITHLVTQSYINLELFLQKALDLIINAPLMCERHCQAAAFYLGNNDEQTLTKLVSHDKDGIFPKQIPLHIASTAATQADYFILPLINENVSNIALLIKFASKEEKSSAILLRLQQHLTHLLEHLQHEQEMSLAAEVFDNSLDGIVITDIRANVIKVNQRFTHITGYSANDIIGQNMGILKSQRHSDFFYQNMWQSLTTTGKWQGEVWNKRKNNEVYPQWLSISSIKDKNNKTLHYVGSFVDLSKQKEQEKRIKSLVFYDILTGLANRQLLNDHLQLAISQSKRKQYNSAVLLIDLDRFKSINDSLGHKVGDFVLTQVAERLINYSREGDTVARYAGDEFVLLLTGLSTNTEQCMLDVATIAKSVLSLVSAPLTYKEHEIVSLSSIGIALYNDKMTAEQLLKQADIAMHSAKGKGRNRYEFFQPSLEDKEIQRFTIEHELHRAIERNEFEIYLQPQTDISSDRIIGAECLLRWHSAHLGWVSPAEFIPVAEETGFIIKIGDWVLNQVCLLLKYWNTTQFLQQLGCKYIAVNVSPMQFAQADFTRKLVDLVGSHQLNDLSLIELELTEGCLMHRSDEAIRTLTQLQSLGLRISIDDFGTGYSNLSYLSSFPLNTLKIDQSFIRNCLIDSGNKAIVRAIIAMAQGLQLNIIAEGVETEQELLFLQREGAQIFQGYLCSKPLPVAQWETFITQYNADK